jgi:SAM-dependent methyltransferase
MDFLKWFGRFLITSKTIRYNLVVPSHHYPDILLRVPWLMIPYFVFCYLCYPRNIFFAYHLYKVIKNKSPLAVLEVGFGEGIHLIPFAVLFPKVKFFGFDIREDNAIFLRNFSSYFNLKNIVILTHNEFNMKGSQTFDIIYMVGVLQYVENDAEFLKFLKEKLTDKGNFMLYQPVHYVRYFKMLDNMVEKYEHYEKEVNLLRKYHLKDLVEVLKNTGFKRLKVYRYIFKYSSIAQEVFRFFYIPVIKSTNLLEKIIGLAGIILFSPLIIVVSHLGNCLETKTNNAVLIVFDN